MILYDIMSNKGNLSKITLYFIYNYLQQKVLFDLTIRLIG